MKTYEELTSEILTKAKAEKKARRKRFIAAGSALSGICLVLAISLVIAHFAGAFPQGGTVSVTDDGANISSAEDYGQIYAMLEIDRVTWFDRILGGVGGLLGGVKSDEAFDMMADGDFGEQAVIENEMTADDAMDAPTDSAGDGTSDPEYSDTNIQVEGIMEADVVKTDGRYIYVLSSNKLHIIAVDGGNMEKVSETEFYTEDAADGYDKEIYCYEVAYSSEMYIRGDRLVIVYTPYGKVSSFSLRTNAAIYDISDRSAPALVTTLGISGEYLTSRMNGGTLYLMSCDRFDDDKIKKSSPETFIPSVSVDGEEEVIDVAEVYCGTDKTVCEYLNICEIDVDNCETKSCISLLGYGSAQIYQSAGYLYAARSVYGVKGEDGTERSQTALAKVSLDGELGLVADAVIDGTVLNSFSMDEYDGYFRIVTTVNQYVTDRNINSDIISTRWGTYNNLYILDSALEVTGKLDNLARDERIYSARFDGDIVYFVTYRETDPLFCADLSDPANPVILSALKIPGFSEYLHKFTDGLLFGLGQSDSGNLKLSMFNITDKANVTEEATQILYDEYYTEASTDHHAILVDSGKNLIAFPGRYYFVYSYADGNFTRKAALPLEFGYYGYSWTARGLYIGDYLFVCTPYGVSSYSLTDFTEQSTVVLTAETGFNEYYK